MSKTGRVKNFTHVQTYLEVGIPIKIALLKSGLLQRQAADLLGLSLSNFNMKLLGRRPFTCAEKAKLAEITATPLETLFLEPDLNECVPDTQARNCCN